MISRSLGVVSLERFLAVERYRQQVPSTHPHGTVESGVCAPAAAPARPVSLILGPPPATPGLGGEPARQRLLSWQCLPPIGSARPLIFAARARRDAIASCVAEDADRWPWRKETTYAR